MKNLILPPHLKCLMLLCVGVSMSLFSYAQYSCSNPTGGFQNFNGGAIDYPTAQSMGLCYEDLEPGEKYCFQFKMPAKGIMVVRLRWNFPDTTNNCYCIDNNHTGINITNTCNIMTSNCDYEMYDESCNKIKNTMMFGHGGQCSVLSEGEIYTICVVVPPSCQPGTKVGFCPLIYCSEGDCGWDKCKDFGASVTSTKVSCKGGSDGTATVTATGGTPPYTYQWSANSGGQTSATVSGLSAGTYSVTVTDSASCYKVKSIDVDEPEDATLTISTGSKNITCFGYNDGKAWVEASGGWENYTYLWSNGETQANISGLAPGTYTITVVDNGGNGCPLNNDEAAVVIKEPADGPLTISAGSKNITCFGYNDGKAWVEAAGGWENYTYLWSNGETQANISGLAPGTYTITVVDNGNNGCPANNDEAAVTIEEPAAGLLTINTSSKNITCFGYNNGQAWFEASGGWGNYTYVWSNGATEAAISNLAPGSYTVTVVDDGGNGCAVNNNEASISISNPTPIIVNAGKDTLLFKGGEYQLGGTPVVEEGGFPPYTYRWSDNYAFYETVENPFARPIHSSLYHLTVTDADGCTATDSVLVRVSDKLELFVPNTFTPNGDGINEVVYVEGRGIKRLISFSIFNRWGQKVFETNDINEGWDGRYKGKLLDSDRYAYCVEVEFYEMNEPFRKNGSVSLVR